MNQDVSTYIENSTQNNKEILIELRKIIFSVVPEANEQFKWSRPVYGLEKDFCYLKPSKKYVALGFFNFNKLTDSNNLLEGTGAQMRHIKIYSVEGIDSVVISEMLNQSVQF